MNKTPHIEVDQEGVIAKTVLMAGDPLRAKFIADNFLENAVLFNRVRNMFGYTGTYKGHKISVMGSGMGMPSIGIYSYELFKNYDVDQIIRIGTAGSYDERCDVFDLVLVDQAYSESNFALCQSREDYHISFADKGINEVIAQTAKEIGARLERGRIHSSDVFYHEDPNYWKSVKEQYDCLAVEMESFALFHNARVTGKKASCIITISDSFINHKVTTAEQRQTAFTDMIKLALESAIKL